MKINELFDKCLSVTASKRGDYTSYPDSDNHENFKRSAQLASWFKDDEDKPYVVLIGTKLARLASLLLDNRKPNNESIEDSFIDLINYCGLWAERRLEGDIKEPIINSLTLEDKISLINGLLSSMNNTELLNLSKELDLERHNRGLK